MSTINQNQLAIKTNSNDGSNSTGPIGFKSGMSASVTAILALIEAFNKISTLKNNQFVNQIQAESQMVQAYSKGQEALGVLEFQEGLASGLGSIVGGVGQLGLYGMGHFSSEGQMKPLQDELNGAEEFKFESKPEVKLQEKSVELEDLSAKPDMNDPEVKAEINAKADKMLERIKSGEFKLVDEKNQPAKLSKEEQEVVDLVDNEKLKELNKAVEKRVSSLKKAFKAKANTVSNQQMTINNLSQVVNSIPSGAAGIYASTTKVDQGKQQADNAEYQAAQQEFQKISDETQSQADKDIQTAIELTQTIVSIDRSNSAILSA